MRDSYCCAIIICLLALTGGAAHRGSHREQHVCKDPIQHEQP